MKPRLAFILAIVISALAGCASYKPVSPAFHAALNQSYRLDSGDVLNGIAHHPESGLFVTGKYWPHLFRIRLQDR